RRLPIPSAGCAARGGSAGRPPPPARAPTPPTVPDRRRPRHPPVLTSWPEAGALPRRGVEHTIAGEGCARRPRTSGGPAPDARGRHRDRSRVLVVVVPPTVTPSRDPLVV